MLEVEITHTVLEVGITHTVLKGGTTHTVLEVDIKGFIRTEVQFFRSGDQETFLAGFLWDKQLQT